MSTPSPISGFRARRGQFGSVLKDLGVDIAILAIGFVISGSDSLAPPVLLGIGVLLSALGECLMFGLNVARYRTLEVVGLPALTVVAVFAGFEAISGTSSSSYAAVMTAGVLVTVAARLLSRYFDRQLPGRAEPPTLG